MLKFIAWKTRLKREDSEPITFISIGVVNEADYQVTPPLVMNYAQALELFGEIIDTIPEESISIDLEMVAL